MTTLINISLKGVEKFEKAQDRMIKNVTKGKTKVIRRGANKLKRELKRRAPERRGILKKAVYTKVYPETSKRLCIGFVGVRPKRAPHARLVEFGHGGSHPAPPHPFFRPTWDTNRESINSEIERGLKQEVEK